MSLPAAVKSASNTVARNVASAKAPQIPPLLTFKYERHPSPLNCTNFVATREFSYDKTHPHHIRTQRRLAAFDPRLLHWNVRVPVDLSKRATVRGWAINRVKVAFREALRDGGLDKDGKNLVVRKQELSGALCIFVSKNKAIIEASGEDVKRECSLLLKRVVNLQRRDGRLQRNGRV